MGVALVPLYEYGQKASQSRAAHASAWATTLKPRIDYLDFTVFPLSFIILPSMILAIERPRRI